MSNSYADQFEEVFNLLQEASSHYSYPPASGAIAANSEAPRKDFAPAGGGTGYPPSMNKRGLLDPYQSHPFSTMPDPDRPAHYAYPLETVNDNLANSCVYLLAAINQIKQATQNNPALDPVFKSELKQLKAQCNAAFNIIKKAGKKIELAANLNY